ncbi:MAG: PAS domain S-box protein [Methanothrix soehngenii]
MWQPNIVRLLKIAGEILANALEQQRVQVALKESELRYRSVVDALGEGIIYSDPDDVILHINSRFCELTGYSASEMLGKKALASSPQEEWNKLRDRTRKRLQGIAEQYEIQLMRRDGTRFWARINATPVRDMSGTIVATLGAITDISERKRAIEALRSSEKKYRDLVETSSDLIWSVGLDGTVTFVNSACRSMYGYEPEEMLGIPFWKFVDESVSEKDRALFHSILTGRQIFQAETRHRRKDGSLISLSINAIPVRGEDGEIIGATGTASDISERKHVEEELRSQREFLRQVIDAVPSYIFVKDSSMRFSLVNEAFASAYQKRPEEILGKSDHDIHPSASDADAFVADCKEVLRSMKPKLVLEDAITNPLTKSVQWHYTIRTPLILPDGSPPQVLTVATDITERKRAEEEALRLEKQLLQAQKMEAIGQLAAGVAHDLNNALGAVVGHLQLLQMSQDLSTSIRNSLDIALGGCERALSLIEQLLGFSRQGRYNLASVSLRDMASETLAFLSKVIDKGIEIRIVGIEENLHVHADAAQIQQAITNLIINAKQAMPRGGALTLAFDHVHVPYPESRNPRALPGHYGVLRVSDTGSGINPSIIDKIFRATPSPQRAQRLKGAKGRVLGSPWYMVSCRIMGAGLK